MELQSCYLEPKQVRSVLGRGGSRGLGVAFLNRNALETFNDEKVFASKDIRFLGLSAAFKVSRQDEELFRIQLSGVGRSVSIHLACCEHAGVQRPYRLISEPGNLVLRQSVKTSSRELIAAIVQSVSQKLPKDFPVEICQNNWMDDRIFQGFVEACDQVSLTRAIVPGLQIWLSPLGRSTAGALMGRRDFLLKRYGSFTVPEFGVESVPVPPTPAPKEGTDWEARWREAIFCRWGLSTGLPLQTWPLWCPLTPYFNGPYRAWNWDTVAQFDEAMAQCYDLVALAGGPVGVGTDFAEVLPPGKPKKGEPGSGRSVPER